MTGLGAPNWNATEVAIYGCYPPPFGGISVHVKRLVPLLETARVSCRVYNGVGDFAEPERIVNITRTKLRAALASFTQRHRVFYVLTTRTSARFWAGVLGFLGRRVILHVDGASLANAIASGSWLERWASRFAVRHAWGVVGVNEDIRELATGIRGSQERVWNVPAYLNPADPDPSQVEGPVRRFIQGHDPVILAMGRFCVIAGKEVYGVPLLIDLLAEVRKQHPRAGLVFALTHPEDLDGPMWPELQARIERNGLADHVFVRPARSELVPLMGSCDLMVRPSTTDGDAVAIREALHCGLPVVASDCVVRPPGTVLHRSEDLGSLVEQTLAVLERRDEMAADLPGVPDNWPALKAIFAEALERTL